MVFPAGIMQAPFFKTDAPVVTNHGGLGMVMGHELTHGFDDEGRQFDGDGNFFVAFAQSWCTNYRPEAARLQAQVNPHSTAQWRVNGPVSDNADFARTFSCKAASPMNPEKKCAVW